MRPDACSSSPAAAAPSCGFTLVEALVALAVAALLLTLGVPAYGDWLRKVELANTASALADTLQRARAEAVKHGGRVNLCKSVDRSHCTSSGGWETGWLLFYDDDRDGQVGSAETVVSIVPAAARGITARANQPLANYVSFTGAGHARLLNGALQMGTFTVCRAGMRGYQVVLAHSGRVRVDRTPGVC